MVDYGREDSLDLLLINPNGRDQIYQELGGELTAVEPPLWCRLIAGYARDRGYTVEIIDAEAEGFGPETVARMACARSPHLVGMIVFGHQPSASTQQMAAASPTCRAIKDINPDQRIIIVGGHVAALPERTLQEEAIDFACNSEGPITVHELLDALRAGEVKDFSKVQGLVWRDDNTIRQNISPPLIKELDQDLHGNVWDLLPMEKYRAHNWQCFGDLKSREPYASIYTSLGCPYKCTFCCINAPFGTNRYRMRSPKAVAAEIDLLHNQYGIKTYKIIDEMFVLNERHVLALCDELIQRDYNLNIWAYARVDTVKPRMLEKLRKAGVRWLALGIESGSEHVRDGAEKSFNQTEIIEIVRQIQQAGISVIGNFIFGLPDDDVTTMQETLKLAAELNCEFANFYSAMAYPGSPLYQMAINNNWALPQTWSGFSQHSYDCLPLPTEKVSAAEVLKFRDDAFNRYFTNKRYLDMVTQKFGWETRRHIERMTHHKLRRKLFEEPGAGSTHRPPPPRIVGPCGRVNTLPAPSPFGQCLATIDVFVLAGGLGTRIRPVLGDTPKLLAMLAGRPYLDHLLDWLNGFGARRVLLGLGYRAEAVVDHLRTRPRSDLELSYVIEPRPLGTAGALRFARRKFSSDPVMVINGDSFADADLCGMVARQRDSGASGTILCAEVTDAGRYGRVVLDQAGFIQNFVEKDAAFHGPALVNAGIYLLSAAFLDRIASDQSGSLENDVFARLPPRSLAAVTGRFQFVDIGTPESLKLAQAIFESHDGPVQRARRTQ